jgi:hypothetical protein
MYEYTAAAVLELLVHLRSDRVQMGVDVLSFRVLYIVLVMMRVERVHIPAATI